MDASRTLGLLVEDEMAASAAASDPRPRLAALLKVHDVVLAELKAQMTPEAFAIWSDMYVRA